MMVTLQQLIRIMPEAKFRASRFIAPLNDAMCEYGIDTPKRQAAFIPQIGHESGRLRWVRELWGPTPEQLRYERDFSAAWPPTSKTDRNKKPFDLGNVEKGDGVRFKGRGLIQTTGRSNYLKTSIALFGDDRLIQFPELLEDPKNACRSAAWFWASRGLNELADAGDQRKICRRINGGYNGLADRLALHEVATRVLT